MNVKIMGKGKNKLRVEFEGEDHTLLNLLRQILWEDSVDYAAYEKSHPFLENPTLVLETDKKDPTNTLKSAAKRMGEQMEEFRKDFERAFGK